MQERIARLQRNGTIGGYTGVLLIAVSHRRQKTVIDQPRDFTFTYTTRATPEARTWMPDGADPNNMFVDATWWDTRIDDLTRRFKEWLLV